MEKQKPGEVYRRFKVYNKLLAFLQSETAKKGIGMNLQAVYYSSPQMYSALHESLDEGLCRIEISYYAPDFDAE